MYEKKILKSTSFGLPIVCVGNLSVGGTGKSPMVEFLVLHLKNKFRVATLSRGYKRKTKGYALASDRTSAIDIGDEPMQFHRKFPDIPVAVGEERLLAVPQLLHDHPETQVIILDDAFQHRAIEPGFNILLTDCSNLFTRDFYLPTGDLRDLKSNYRRANIIVVTKCPHGMKEEERAAVIRELAPTGTQTVYFTSIAYGTPYHILKHDFRVLDADTDILLVTGIANPKPLKQFLEDRVQIYDMLHYRDHHIFSIDDWKEILRRFNQLGSSRKIILTTEKDSMRLLKFSQEIKGLPFYVLPIEHRFLFHQETQFTDEVSKFIKNYKPQS